MKKVVALSLILLYFSVKTLAQKAERSLTPMRISGMTHLFYPYDRASGVIDSVFIAADSLFSSVNRLDILQRGSNIVKQLTIHTVIGFKNSWGESFNYEKTYIMGLRNDGVLLFREEYLSKIGALFDYKDRNVLAQAIIQFLFTTARAYKVGKT